MRLTINVMKCNVCVSYTRDDVINSFSYLVFHESTHKLY